MQMIETFEAVYIYIGIFNLIKKYKSIRLFFYMHFFGMKKCV